MKSLPDVGKSLLVRVAAGVALCAWATLSWRDLRPVPSQPGIRAALITGAIVFGCLAVLPVVGRILVRGVEQIPLRVSIAVLAVTTAGLSCWTYFGPMRGQVMARDASVYVLQARAMAHGHFGMPAFLPRISQSVHFLVFGADGRLHGIFPPGFPLFLAPFARFGVEWLAVPLVAALLAIATAAFAHAVSGDGRTTRLSVAIAIASFAWAIETADLLSHAFVALLAIVAILATLRVCAGASWRAAVVLGACVGWTLASRMLDGIALCAAVGCLLAGSMIRRPRLLLRAPVIVVAALPFLVLVAAQQHVATGSWRRPVTVEYARRADWPPTCLRLGFGRDIGCVVEHSDERATFGADGYTPDDALRIVRQRTGRLNRELFGLGALALIGFAGVVVRPSVPAFTGIAFATLLTLFYGLFYYGNAIIHGARHIFPAAPFVVVALADTLVRAASTRNPIGNRAGAGLAAGVIAMIGVALPQQWRAGRTLTWRVQHSRSHARRLFRTRPVDRGVVIVQDIHTYLNALDPWTDAGRRIVALDDLAGSVELRRFYRNMPVYHLATDEALRWVGSAPPPPGVTVELERGWPALAFAQGAGIGTVHTPTCCNINSSGGHVLFVFEASRDAIVHVPFDNADTGDFRFRVEGLRAPDYGNWTLSIDDVEIGQWRGFSRRIERVEGEWSQPMRFHAGPHAFRARCDGRDAESRGYLVSFDRLVGEPADVPVEPAAAP